MGGQMLEKTTIRMALLAGGARDQTMSRVQRINWIAEHFPDPEDQREYAREKCVEVIGSAVERAMDHAGLNRAALADKMGKTKGQLSRILSGAHNMTLRTLGDVLWACDVEVEDLTLKPLGVVDIATSGNQWHDLPTDRVPGGAIM